MQLSLNFTCLHSITLLHKNNNIFSCLVESKPAEMKTSCLVFSAQTRSDQSQSALNSQQTASMQRQEISSLSTEMQMSVTGCCRFSGPFSLIHTCHRSQRLSQRARLLQIIGDFSIFIAIDCNSRRSYQICSVALISLQADERHQPLSMSKSAMTTTFFEPRKNPQIGPNSSTRSLRL